MRGGKDLGVMRVEDFLSRILAENESRGSGE